MWKGGINTLGVLKILTQQFARGARSVVRRFEVMLHDERLFRTTVAKCTTENKTLPLYPLRCAKRGVGMHASLRLPGDGYRKAAHKIETSLVRATKPVRKLH